MSLTPRTQTAIQILFRPEEQAQVAELLDRDCGAGLPLMGVEKAEGVERIQLAVLKCGNGTLDGTLNAVVLAQKDWRDVLAAAGFGEDLAAHLIWDPREINLAKAKDLYLYSGCSTYGMCHEGYMDEYGRLIGSLWGTSTHGELVEAWEEEYIASEIPRLFGCDINTQHLTLVGFGMHRWWANRVVPDILKLMRSCDDYMRLWCADALLNLAWPLHGDPADPAFLPVREETSAVLWHLAHDPLIFSEETRKYFKNQADWYSSQTRRPSDLPTDIHLYVQRFAEERLRKISNEAPDDAVPPATTSPYVPRYTPQPLADKIESPTATSPITSRVDKNIPRTPGFRLSPRDALVLAASAGLYFLAHAFLPDFAWLIPFVVAHFFFFCNMLRPGTKLELIWAGWFMAQLVGWAVWKGELALLPVLAIQTPMTLAIALITLRSPDYHGVFWRKVNPNWKVTLA